MSHPLCRTTRISSLKQIRRAILSFLRTLPPPAPEGLPPPNFHRPHSIGCGPVEHGRSQGLGFNLYTTPYNTSCYQRPPIYSHLHHTPHHVSALLPSGPSPPNPQPNFIQPWRSVVGDGKLSTPVSQDKGKGTEARKQKGAESDENQAPKRPRDGKKQSLKSMGPKHGVIFLGTHMP